MSEYNPIKSVDGSAVKCPSSYRWKLEDISSQNAGRTEDGRMDKMRKGQIVGLELKWQNVKTADASAILQAFNPQYITVAYLDPKEGAYRTSVFYVGDRSVPLYNCQTGLWSEISFNLVERTLTTIAGDEEVTA